jgi:SAM-dependent methyltransferase
LTSGKKGVINPDFSSIENQSISKEMIVHGPRFASVFGGYFSDPDIALPLVEAVQRIIDVTHPQVLADLGGGTGFILEELLRRGLQGVRLVNVEASPKQLAACTDSRIVPLPASVDRVTRRELLAEDTNGKLLLIARAVLHYFGRSSIDPLLRHLKDQLRPGEFFVHQSGAFKHQQDADVINHLYARMDTGKWFFTIDELKSRLDDAGFVVHEIIPAPGLEMGSDDLGERYGLSLEQRASIGKEIERLFGQNREVFVCNGGEFIVRLHTTIFVCEAV